MDPGQVLEKYDDIISKDYMIELIMASLYYKPENWAMY
jgi:hypothetical protein